MSELRVCAAPERLQAHAAHAHPQLLPGGRLHQAALPGLYGGRGVQRQALRKGKKTKNIQIQKKGNKNDKQLACWVG